MYSGIPGLGGLFYYGKILGKGKKVKTEIDIFYLIKTFAVILSSLGIVIEFIPIKINPISWLLEKIGAALNKKLNEKIDELSQQMTAHEVDQLRWNILDFANSCRQGRRHTKEEFDHVIACHSDYEKILKKNKLENGQVKTDYKYIEELYYKCMKENDFL